MGLIREEIVLAKIGGAIAGGVALIALYCVAVMADIVVATSIALTADAPRRRT